MSSEYLSTRYDSADGHMAATKTAASETKDPAERYATDGILISRRRTGVTGARSRKIPPRRPVVRRRLQLLRPTATRRAIPVRFINFFYRSTDRLQPRTHVNHAASPRVDVDKRRRQHCGSAASIILYIYMGSEGLLYIITILYRGTCNETERSTADEITAPSRYYKISTLTIILL